jgi:putative transposase
VVESTLELSSWLRKQLEQASRDLLWAMVQDFTEAVMGAEADALGGAAYGERSPERVNKRNGYRERDWDTRVGTIALQISKLRAGSYFPDWLLEPRRRAEQAFMSVIADSYLAGVSTRRVDKLVRQLGVEGMSRSQVSRLARSLDAIVEQFRTRPLEGAPYPYLVLDALEVKCREGGRTRGCPRPWSGWRAEYGGARSSVASSRKEGRRHSKSERHRGRSRELRTRSSHSVVTTTAVS